MKGKITFNKADIGILGSPGSVDMLILVNLPNIGKPPTQGQSFWCLALFKPIFPHN